MKGPGSDAGAFLSQAVAEADFVNHGPQFSSMHPANAIVRFAQNITARRA
jgi:hypothetical protein